VTGADRSSQYDCTAASIDCVSSHDAVGSFHAVSIASANAPDTFCWVRKVGVPSIARLPIEYPDITPANALE
jgi:hypothetical protein